MNVPAHSAGANVHPKTSFEVSRSGSKEAGNAVLTGGGTMPGSHMARNTIHPNGEKNADFKIIRASCKTLQLANQHGLLSQLGDWEGRSLLRLKMRTQ